MAAPWQNADGLTVPFPNFWADPYNQRNRLSTPRTAGEVKEAFMDVDLTLLPAGTTSYTSDLNNDTVRDGFNTGDDRLPADAAIVQVRAVVREAAAGGTSFTVGTYQLNGTAINATGLITATDGALANINAVGKKVYGSGAFNAQTSGTPGLGSLDSYVGVTTQGTFTSGRLRLVISYIDAHADVDTTR